MTVDIHALRGDDDRRAFKSGDEALELYFHRYTGRRMPPYPLPVLRIARLAVGRDDQGRGLGRAMLRFSVELAEKMRDELGCVGIVVDAKSTAVEFYRRYGFLAVEEEEGGQRVMPLPQMMFLPLGAVPPRR